MITEEKRKIMLEKIDDLTFELKECDCNDRYEKLWEERRLLKEELSAN